MAAMTSVANDLLKVERARCSSLERAFSLMNICITIVTFLPLRLRSFRVFVVRECKIIHYGVKLSRPITCKSWVSLKILCNVSGRSFVETSLRLPSVHAAILKKHNA